MRKTGEQGTESHRTMPSTRKERISLRKEEEFYTLAANAAVRKSNAMVQNRALTAPCIAMVRPLYRKTRIDMPFE